MYKNFSQKPSNDDTFWRPCGGYCIRYIPVGGGRLIVKLIIQE